MGVYSTIFFVATAAIRPLSDSAFTFSVEVNAASCTLPVVLYMNVVSSSQNMILSPFEEISESVAVRPVCEPTCACDVKEPMVTVSPERLYNDTASIPLIGLPIAITLPSLDAARFLYLYD